MQTATKPLVGARAVPLSRRASFLVAEARRKPSTNSRRTRVGSTSTTTTTTTTLTDVNGPALTTVAKPGHQYDLKQTVEMKATVSVHMKSFWWSDEKKERARDWAYDLILGSWLTLELVSSELDPNTGQEHDVISGKLKHSRETEKDYDLYEAIFTVPASFGPIGAVRLVNYHHTEMLLGEVKIFPAGEDPTKSSAVTLFHCHSWIDPSHCSPDKRTFFPVEKSYIPSQTPKGVEKLRKSELEALRGNGCGERKKHDRIYDYDVYNDLGKPESKRPVLGGKEHPYPRRCRTGRPRSKTDPSSEEESHKKGEMYVPRDETFTERKEQAFLTKQLLSQLHGLCTGLKVNKDILPSFPTLASIDALYDDDFRNQPVQPEGGKVRLILDLLAKELVHLVKLEGAEFVEGLRRVFKFETPEIHDMDKLAWFRDEEFARQTLAGMNPLSIQLVTELPIVSKLDELKYGPADSLITKELIEKQINRIMTAEEAVAQKKLFMLDYHDLLLPYVHRVRKLDNKTMYGSRTLFFLADDGTLRPIAIELTRPKSPHKQQWRKVFTPGSGYSGSVTGSWEWQLAKIHVLSHDTGYHQLVSHWLRTHCCVEPYVIAANRQLSQMHPIYRLLHPHFRFTMEINYTLLPELSSASETMGCRMKNKHLWKLTMVLLSTSHQSFQLVSTDQCLSNIISFLHNILPFMKKCFRERVEPGDVHTNPQVALGALVSLLAYFCTECDNRISMLENKISDSYRLLAKILFFCSGEVIALAKLVHKIEFLNENGTKNDVHMCDSFRHCIHIIQGSLHSTNMQVQMLGIHVLKTCAQRELTEVSQTETHSFMILLGELLGDVFDLMQTALKNCSSQESVNVIDDCLKLLFLFHTLAQSQKYQQEATVLLLDALLMVFYLSDDNASQELTEVNTISKKLFSHFIQIPSAAIQIKDVMLSAPPTKRQQLQDMIRASVSHGQIIVPLNTSVQSQQNVQDSSKKPGSVAIASGADAVEEKDEDEVSDDDWDDDWDTFQSLPATAAKDDADSAVGVSPIPEQGSVVSSQEQIHQGNTNHDIGDMDLAAGTIEDRESADRVFGEPSASQRSSPKPQVNRESLESSYEDDEEVPRYPTVDCMEQPADVLMNECTVGELQQDHDNQFGCNERNNGDLDPASEDNSRDDPTSSLNKTSDVVVNEGSDMLSTGDIKDSGVELAPSSHVLDTMNASISGNDTSTSNASEQPDNADTKPESSVGESSES